MKILGFDITREKKKSIATPSRSAMQNYMISTGTNWISIADVNHAKEFIRYGYDQLDAVYAPVNFVADLMSRIKVRLKNKDTGEYLDNHPILDLIQNPNERTTFDEWINQYYGFKKVTGNYYCFAERLNENSEPTALYTFPSQYTEVLVSNLGSIYAPDLEGYKLTFNSVNFKVPKSEVKHWTEPKLSIQNDADMFYGMSAFRPIARKIKTDNGALTSAVKFLENGGLRGYLAPTDAGEDAPEVGEEFLTNTKNKLRENGQGEHNANDILVFAIPMNWTDLGAKMVDMQLFDIDKMTVKSVCRILKISDILMGNDEASTYDNVRIASQDAYLKAAIPEFEKFTNGLNQWLKPMFKGLENFELCGDFNSIPEIQAYRLQQSQAYQPFIESMSDNEVRTQVLGLDPKDTNEEGWEFADEPIREARINSQLRFYDNGQSEQTSE